MSNFVLLTLTQVEGPKSIMRFSRSGERCNRLAIPGISYFCNPELSVRQPRRSKNLDH